MLNNELTQTTKNTEANDSNQQKASVLAQPTKTEDITFEEGVVIHSHEAERKIAGTVGMIRKSGALVRRGGEQIKSLKVYSSKLKPLEKYFRNFRDFQNFREGRAYQIPIDRRIDFLKGAIFAKYPQLLSIECYTFYVEYFHTPIDTLKEQHLIIQERRQVMNNLSKGNVMISTVELQYTRLAEDRVTSFDLIQTLSHWWQNPGKFISLTIPPITRALCSEFNRAVNHCYNQIALFHDQRAREFGSRGLDYYETDANWSFNTFETMLGFLSLCGAPVWARVEYVANHPLENVHAELAITPPGANLAENDTPYLSEELVTSQENSNVYLASAEPIKRSEFKKSWGELQFDRGSLGDGTPTAGLHWTNTPFNQNVDLSISLDNDTVQGVWSRLRRLTVGIDSELFTVNLPGGQQFQYEYTLYYSKAKITFYPEGKVIGKYKTKSNGGDWEIVEIFAKGYTRECEFELLKHELEGIKYRKIKIETVVNTQLNIWGNKCKTQGFSKFELEYNAAVEAKNYPLARQIARAFDTQYQIYLEGQFLPNILSNIDTLDNHTRNISHETAVVGLVELMSRNPDVALANAIIAGINGYYTEKQQITLLHIADMLEEMGDLKTAVTFYEKTLDLNNAKHVKYLGQCYLELNQPEKTKDLYEKYNQDSTDKDNEISHYLAVDNLHTQRYEKAVAILSHVTNQDAELYYLKGVSLLQHACQQAKEKNLVHQEYLDGKTCCHDVIDRLQSQDSLTNDEKNTLCFLKKLLAVGALYYEEKTLALLAVKDCLIYSPDDEAMLLTAANLSFDEKHNREAIGYVETTLRKSPENEKAKTLHAQLQNVVASRFNVFFFDVGCFITKELLGTGIRHQYFVHLGDRGQRIAKQGAAVLQLVDTAGKYYLREQCENYIRAINPLDERKTFPTSDPSNHLFLFASRAIDILQMSLNAIETLNTFEVIPQDRQNQERLRTIIKHGHTASDLGSIFMLSSSLYTSEIVSLSNFMANNQAILSGLSLAATTCRVINRYTYEAWRQENKALPENAMSNIAEDALDIASSPTTAMLLTVVKKCIEYSREYPEEVSELIGYIPYMSRGVEYASEAGTLAINGLNTLWLWGVAGKVTVITGGVCLIVGAGYGINQYLEHRACETIAYNANAARNRNDFETAKISYEQLKEKQPNERNQKMCAIFNAEYLAHHQRWNELHQCMTTQLEKDTDPFFYEYRGHAASAQHQLVSAKQDYLAALERTPNDHTLKRFGLQLALMNVAPEEPAVQETVFNSLQAIQLGNNTKETVEASKYLKSTLMAQTKKTYADKNSLQCVQRSLSQWLEKYNTNDADIIFGKGRLALTHQLTESALYEFDTSLRFANTPVQKQKAMMGLAEAFLTIGEFKKAMAHLHHAKQHQETPESKQYTESLEAALNGAIQRSKCDIDAQVNRQYDKMLASIDAISEQVEVDEEQLRTTVEQLNTSMTGQIQTLADKFPSGALRSILFLIEDKKSDCLIKIAQKQEKIRADAWQQLATSSVNTLIRGGIGYFFDCCHTAARERSALLAADLEYFSRKDESSDQEEAPISYWI